MIRRQEKLSSEMGVLGERPCKFVWGAFQRFFVPESVISRAASYGRRGALRMNPAGILERLIEIGKALNAKNDTLYAEDLHKIRQMVIEAQDFVLCTEKSFFKTQAAD